MINLGQFKHRNSVIDTNMMLLQKSQHLIWPFGGLTLTLQIFRDRTRQHSWSSRLELKWTVRECVLQTKNWPINNNASYLVFGKSSPVDDSGWLYSKPPFSLKSWPERLRGIENVLLSALVFANWANKKASNERLPLASLAESTSRRITTHKVKSKKLLKHKMHKLQS